MRRKEEGISFSLFSLILVFDKLFFLVNYCIKKNVGDKKTRKINCQFFLKKVLNQSQALKEVTGMLKYGH